MYEGSDADNILVTQEMSRMRFNVLKGQADACSFIENHYRNSVSLTFCEQGKLLVCKKIQGTAWQK